MPMPALNIIAIHDDVRNSGFSSSRPSGILPYRLAAIHRMKTTNTDASRTNSQPPFVITQVVASPDWVASEVRSRTPHATKASDATAVTPKTSQSMEPVKEDLAPPGGPEPGSSAGVDGSC